MFTKLRYIDTPIDRNVNTCFDKKSQAMLQKNDTYKLVSLGSFWTSMQMIELCIIIETSWMVKDKMTFLQLRHLQ